MLRWAQKLLTFTYMKAGTLLTALLVTLLGAAPAFAGGYFSLGVGDDATLHGDLAQQFDTDSDTQHARLAIGQRTGPIAIEASMFGTGLRGVNGDYRTVSLGVDIKYFYGLGGNFELFGKGGLNKTWLQGTDDQGGDASGRGKLLGVGVQYRFTTGLVGEAAVWLDLSRQFVELSGAQTATLDGEIDMMNIGLSVGL